MRRATWEAATGRWQVLVYLAAILVGLGVGTALPDVTAVLAALVWPLLGALLLTTFLQTPLTGLSGVARDARFLGTALFGNFVLVPLVVLVLVRSLPDDDALRVGVALVLLVPCTDWFLTFAHLGGADVRRALVLTPLQLGAQLAALPALLVVVLGATTVGHLDAGELLRVFGALIVLPLALAALLQRAARGRPGVRRAIARTEPLPVLLLAAVLLLVAASQVEQLRDVPLAATAARLAPALGVFVGYLAVALALGWALTRTLGLPPPAGRALTFSLGTRNSFVVLPLALALPTGLEAAVTVVVLQSLVELFGMLVYLRVVPRLLPSDPRSRRTAA